MNKKIMLIHLISLIFTSSIFSFDLNIDSNNNGKDDRWINGVLMKDWKKLDINKNNKPDESCFYVADSQNIFFITEEKFDYSGNGEVNIWITNEIKGKDFYTVIKADENNDGVIDFIDYKKNDIEYLKVMDTNNDKKFDLEERYDENGVKIKESVDTNKDGKMDDNYYFKGETILKQEIDSNYDGKPDIWVTFKYKKDGTTEKCLIERDNNFDGKVDEWHYTDESRRVIRIEKDTDFDGKVDDIQKLD